MRPLVGLVLAVAVLALGVAPSADGAAVGPLEVGLEAQVGAARQLSPVVTRWEVVGVARYAGMLDGRDSSLSLYDQTHEPVARWAFASAWPTKVDVDGLERDVTFACGILTTELGGTCVAVGAVVGFGSARIVEHDLRAGGRLVWELAVPRALCPRCP